MTEQKAKLSKLCLTGFLISILSPFALAGFAYFFPDETSAFYWITIAVLICLPFVGMIISIVGLATARKKGRTGKVLGIAGIVLPNAYAAMVVIIVAAVIFIMLAGQKSTMESEKSSDLYCFGGIDVYAEIGDEANRYRLTRDFDLDSPDITVSESELKDYSGSKLDEISDINSIRAKGRYRNYNFIIVRTDCINEWQNADSLAYISYSKDGNAGISYSQTIEFSAAATYELDIYKDPSDKFIIITNCSDTEVISDFFG